jgi:hypothetical protein
MTQEELMHPGHKRCRSDVYSLGILLFEMVSGRLPFQGDTEFELLKHQIETPMPVLSTVVSGVPAFLDAAISNACAKAPGERFETCAAMAQALRSGPGATGFGAELAAPSTLSEVDPWRQRIDALLAIGEIDVAEHALENALADFPEEAVLKRCRDLIAKARTQRNSEAPARTAERNLFVKETLDRLREHERDGTWQEGCQTAREALNRYPRVWVFLLVNCAGGAIGLALAGGLSRWISSLLFGITPLDPLTYAASGALIAAAAMIASYVPARQAAPVDPMETLRSE